MKHGEQIFNVAVCLINIVCGYVVKSFWCTPRCVQSGTGHFFHLLIWRPCSVLQSLHFWEKNACDIVTQPVVGVFRSCVYQIPVLTTFLPDFWWLKSPVLVFPWMKSILWLGNSIRSSNWAPHIFLGNMDYGWPGRSESLPPFTTG